MKADIDRIAVISTAHITPDDNVLFKKVTTYPLTTFHYEGGIILPLLATEVLTARQRTEVLDWGFSQSVVEIIMWAHYNRFAGVRLDRDGPIVSELASYDW